MNDWIAVTSGNLPEAGQQIWLTDGTVTHSLYYGIPEPVREWFEKENHVIAWMPATIPSPPTPDMSDEDEAWEQAEWDKESNAGTLNKSKREIYSMGYRAGLAAKKGKENQ